MQTEEFRYPLPVGAIAQRPVHPRHDARLLDTRDRSDHTFFELPDLLLPGDLVVVNTTRVRAARLRGKRATGGGVEILLLRDAGEGAWEALLRPARRLRAGEAIELEGAVARLLTDPSAGTAIVELRATHQPELRPDELIETVGEVPLPPYVNQPVPDEEYQTVYAERLGSAAAPTAGLHFTAQVLARLEAAEIGLASVDLEVGLDTFRPIDSNTVEEHIIHSERFEVPAPTAEAISDTRSVGGRIVAVGTTVVRALESAAQKGKVVPGAAATDLFIKPGYRFRVVDLVVTNFHVPGSTLVVMIAAMMGSSWKEAYELALERGYRFLSFGDAMLTVVR